MLVESLPGPSFGPQRLAEGHLAQSRHQCRGLVPPRQSSRQSSRSASTSRSVVRAALQADVLQYRDVEYDPRRNSEYWQTRPVAVLKRSLEIALAFGGWFGAVKLRGWQDLSNIGGQEADRLRRILVKLGPAFVKIGQAVSSRPDVVPPAYLSELEKLQDRIPPFSDAAALALIESELGQPISVVFSELTSTTVAAASLGQVYKGRLRSNGAVVAVKVQRPGVRESIALDIHILRGILTQVKKLRQVNSDLPALLDEWASSLFRELDYQREADNGKRFADLYGTMEGVYVPGMNPEHTTQRVLVMEWVNGQRLRSRAEALGEGKGFLNRDDLKLIDIGVRCSLEQMLEEGFYHSDPHQGNLLKLPDGKLGYIDFGMVGSIDTPTRRGLIRATIHMVNREFGSLADDFVALGLLPPDADLDEIVPALTDVFSEALRAGVSNVSFGELSNNLGQTMYKYNFRIPAYYTLLVRSLSVLEGIALTSDPNYKVLAAAYPWIARRLLTNQTPELRDTLHALLYKNNQFQFKRLESLLEQAVRSPARRPAAVPATATSPAVGAATPTAAPASAPAQVPSPNNMQGGQALGLLLSPEGEYVRGIVTNELAKGIDASWRLALDSAVDGLRSQLLAVFGMQGREQALNAGRYEGLPGASLLDALASLPPLANAEDRLQLEGIQRLVAQLQRLARQTAPAAGTQGLPSQVQEAASQGDAQAGALTQAAAILQWLGTELQALDTGARVEAVRLVGALAGQVFARAAARAVKQQLAPPRPPIKEDTRPYSSYSTRNVSTPAAAPQPAGAGVDQVSIPQVSLEGGGYSATPEVGASRTAISIGPGPLPDDVPSSYQNGSGNGSQKGARSSIVSGNGTQADSDIDMFGEAEDRPAGSNGSQAYGSGNGTSSRSSDLSRNVVRKETGMRTLEPAAAAR